MKKLLTLLCLCCLCIGSAWGEDYSAIFTSNVALSTEGGTSASTCKVQYDFNNDAKYTTNDEVFDGIKAGTSSAAGAVKINIPTGTKTLHMHIVGWNGEKVEVTLTAGTSTTRYTLTSDAGVSGNTPFSLKTDPSTYYYTYNVAEGVTSITLKATTGKRFVIFGVNAEEGTTSTQTLESIAISGTPTKTTYEAGEEFDPAGLVVTGTYDDSSTDEITDGITWDVTPSGALAAGTTSVSVTATVNGVTSEAYTVDGLTVTAAPLSVTWDASQQGYENEQSVTSVNLLNDAISVRFDGGKYYNTGTAVRVYGGKTLTVSSTTLKITKIEFTFGTGDGQNEISAKVGTYTDGIWEGKSSNVEFTVGGTSGNRRFQAIKVYYEEAGDIVANPTFSVESGIYFEPFTVTLASTTEGALIYYTTNGDDPTTASTLYENPINVSETTTIKAIAIKEGLDNSEVVVKTFTFGPTYNSLADLVADGEPTGETVKVTLTNETITRLVTNGVMLKSGNQEVEIYNYNVPAEWKVGGTLSGTITCPWKKFGSTWELCPENWDDFEYAAPTDLFNVTIAESITNGTVTADPSEAVEGQEITLTVTPADGYKLTSLTVSYTDATDEPVNVEVSNNKFTMPASDVTVSATFSPLATYTITWMANGTEFATTQVVEGDALALPETNPADVNGYSFCGWIASESYSNETTAPEYIVPANIIPTADVTYYAVFAKASEGGVEEYVKVTSAPADWTGQYLLVYEDEKENKAYVWTGVDAVNCCSESTIANGSIAAKPESAATIAIAPMTNGYSIKVCGGDNDGKYIYGTSGSNVLNFSDDANLNTIEYEEGCVKITSNTSVMRFNSASNNMRFRYFKSSSYTVQQAVQLYKLSGGTTYSDYCTTITIPEASIECETTLELTADGSDGTFDVTWTNVEDIDVQLYADAGCLTPFNGSWFQVELDDDNNVYYLADANSSTTESRTVYMQLFALDSDANEITKVVTVIQAASTDPYLNIAENIEVGAEGGNTTISAPMCNVKEGYTLTLSVPENSWISNLSYENENVTFTFAANPKNTPRTETVTWTYEYTGTEGVNPSYTGAFTVTQAAAEIYNLIQTLADNTTTKSYVEEGGSVTLTDAGIKSIEITEDIEDVNITYTRSFSNTNWQAWYMPFEIDPADLPEGFEVAYINDNHIIDGDIKIEIVALEAGQIMMANHPYVIKAPAADTYEIKTTSTLYQTKENTIDCSSTTNMFYFNGTYQLTSMDNVEGKPYGLSDGKFTSLEGYDSKPYRFYMNIVPRDGSQYITLPNEIKLVNIFGEDLDDADAISEIKSESVREGAYDLMGRKATSLVKGNVYIINGKKTYIRQ